MKIFKLVSLVYAILIFSTLIFGQTTYPVKWYEYNTNTTQTINYMNFPYASGNSGTFLKWNGNYERWDKTMLPTTDNLLYIYWPFIIGDNGAMFKSTNYGINWVNYYFGENRKLNSLSGFRVTSNNTQFYFVVSDSGKIYYNSSAGSTTWNEMNSGTANNLNSIKFNLSTSNGLLLGLVVGNSGTILKFQSFTNGWEKVNTAYSQNLNCIGFADVHNAYAVGDNGLLIHSQDSGRTWSRINLNTNANLKTITFYENNNLVDGIIGGDNGSCFISTNRGANWISENTTFNYNYRASSLQAYSNLYYLAGENGKIIVRTYDSLYWHNYSFNPNNIKTTFIKDGTFNSNILYSGGVAPGFRWPKDSLSFAVFTSGFNLYANVNNIRKMAGASFSGEYVPGSCSNGIINTDAKFKMYKVRKCESPQGYDYKNWDKMVPYGAPFYDRNHNGTYEPDIDLPGVKGANETVFLCMTDADPQHHYSGTGFGGGTQPLYAEVHVTMWGYNSGKMKDVIFMKYEIINKSQQGNQYVWDSTYAGFFYDYDIGDPYNNYMGSDSLRNLAYGYCSKDTVTNYGIHPPAVGMNILKGLKVNNIIRRTTSAIRIHRYPNDPVKCEIEPEGNLTGAINIMKGYKSDGTKWVIPFTNPPKITKFTFSGDPETATGWNPPLGRVSNCGDSLTGTVLPEPLGDTRFVMCTGDDNLKMYPGDTQIVYAAQLIARGISNLNSVTKLKELNDSVQAYFDAGFPVSDSTIEFPAYYLLSQNYPNPFNSITRIKFYLPVSDYVTIKVYDVSGREITNIVNGYFIPGRYEVQWDAKNYSSGVYFYSFSTSGYRVVKKMVLIK